MIRTLIGIFFNFFAEILIFNFLGWWFVSQKIGRSCWFASFSTWNLVLAKAISRSDNQRHARISDSVYSFFCCWAFQVRIKTLKMFIRYTIKSKVYHATSGKDKKSFFESELVYLSLCISLQLIRLFYILSIKRLNDHSEYF